MSRHSYYSRSHPQGNPSYNTGGMSLQNVGDYVSQRLVPELKKNTDRHITVVINTNPMKAPGAEINGQMGSSSQTDEVLSSGRDQRDHSHSRPRYRRKSRSRSTHRVRRGSREDIYKTSSLHIQRPVSRHGGNSNMHDSRGRSHSLHHHRPFPSRSRSRSRNRNRRRSHSRDRRNQSRSCSRSRSRTSHHAQIRSSSLEVQTQPRQIARRRVHRSPSPYPCAPSQSTLVPTVLSPDDPSGGPSTCIHSRAPSPPPIHVANTRRPRRQYRDSSPPAPPFVSPSFKYERRRVLRPRLSTPPLLSPPPPVQPLQQVYNDYYEYRHEYPPLPRTNQVIMDFCEGCSHWKPVNVERQCNVCAYRFWTVVAPGVVPPRVQAPGPGRQYHDAGMEEWNRQKQEWDRWNAWRRGEDARREEARIQEEWSRWERDREAGRVWEGWDESGEWRGDLRRRRYCSPPPPAQRQVVRRRHSFGDGREVERGYEGDVEERGRRERREY
ncbi:hypothetical protein QBC43DRAFT_331092 [Cladorrhinum sp. PSN259]|nr:hypothetical protein QBC43DRAFT_331092 [Cladorrhinum sp. PSN259]